MTRLDVAPSRSLAGTRVALSVSESPDLDRLGLAADHCVRAVAEIARAVFIAGGELVYGGRIRDLGFTGTVLEEAANYGGPRRVLTLAVPHTEHYDVPREEISALRERLGLGVNLVLLDSHGAEIGDDDPGPPAEPAVALTAMRRYVSAECAARVVVGGKLTGYQGAVPGVLEEALESIHAGRPVFAAGGFGGAAAALARALGFDDGGWRPADVPEGADDAGALSVVREVIGLRDRLAPDGLTPPERSRLAATHRPGDIASMVVRGLSRARAALPAPDADESAD